MNIPPSTECENCYDAAATKTWDLGPDHMFWTGVRYERLCDECYRIRENYTGPDEPDYDAPTAQETYEKAYKAKYGN